MKPPCIISPATASRDLKDGVSQGILEKSGDKRMAKYRYLKKLHDEQAVNFHFYLKIQGIIV